jgi:integrase
VAAGSASRIADAGDVEAARRWAPWLAAYTGARFTDLVRLHWEDWRRDDGGWSVTLRNAPDPVGRSKAVLVPSDLVELGFAALVEGRAPGPLFFAGKPRDETAYARLAKAARRDGAMGARELRRRFKIELRKARVERTVIDAILGREPESYKSRFDVPLHHLREAIEKLPQMSVGAAS